MERPKEKRKTVIPFPGASPTPPTPHSPFPIPHSPFPIPHSQQPRTLYLI
ncbi:MAG: hypothetical protein F6K31_26885 [Symploca sp. SIO2G7]|nr:hypothetical protein [Symploca sp. SIO2G7]